jgi:hypothetical protein
METILCAAIWYRDIPLKKLNIPNQNPVNITEGAVFCGYRHPHCMYTMVAVTGIRSVENGENSIGYYEQGFLTSKNRFVRRVEALEIALKGNQVRNVADVRGNRLHSEDLY